MSLATAIEASTKPAFLVDAYGMLQRANVPGRAALDRQEFLRLRDGLIRPVNPEHDRRFSRLLWSVTVPTDPSIPGGALRLSDGNGASSLLFVHPATSFPSDAGLDGSRAVLLLGDQAHDAEIDAIRLRVTFGFTSAEDRLVRDLIRGRSLTDVAEKYEVGRETLKSQLASLFKKTGTHRQGELVALLLSSLPDPSE